jgi:type VI secretion system secreted protein Hcp
MAMDIVIKIDGFKGESKVDGHKDSIDVLAWSWGLSNSGSFHIGGGGGTGKANVQDLSFTKWLDAASPDLMLACATGKHIKKATLTVRKAGDKPLEYWKIELSDLMISSVSSGGSGGEDRLTENVSLNFAKVEVTYAGQDEKGGKAEPKTTGFDIPAGKSI